MGDVGGLDGGVEFFFVVVGFCVVEVGVFCFEGGDGGGDDIFVEFGFVVVFEVCGVEVVVEFLYRWLGEGR